jgi:phosphinothricin acetyltransferase
MIRAAKIEDLEAMSEIYNQAIDAQFQTCFTRRFSAGERLPWFYQHQGTGYPLYVYEQDGRVAGWLSVSAYRQGRNALRYAVEISYFIHSLYHKRGIGSLLLAHAIDQCRVFGYKTALAILLEPNTGSLKLLEKFGFERWGYLPDIAEFNGIPCGQYYYGLRLQGNNQL